MLFSYTVYDMVSPCSYGMKFAVSALVSRTSFVPAFFFSPLKAPS